MKKTRIDEAYLIVMRYIILLGLVFSLPLFYKIFSPLTIYPVVWLLHRAYGEIILTQNIISIFGKILIELIPACIAGSAYLLLLILNLSLPMGLKQRIYTILASFTILLVLNIFRIFILSLMYVNGNDFFDITHKLFWYGLSTFFVVGIWFLMVRLFKIKGIPVYTDIKYFIKEIKRGK